MLKTLDRFKNFLNTKCRDRKNVLIIAGVLVVCLFAAFAALADKSGLEVKAGDKSIAIVKEQSDVEKTIAEIVKEKQKELGLPIRCATEVQYTEISLKDKEVTSPQTLKKILAEKLVYEAQGIGIIANGETAAVLKSEALAKQALEKVKQDAKAELENDGKAKVKEVKIKEPIKFEQRWIAVKELKNPAQAAEVLRTGADKQEKYTVVEGDTLWDIARSHGMSVEELQKANPQLNSDRLSLGQEINIVVVKPFITVCTVEERVIEESIPFKVVVEKDKTLYTGTRKVKEKGEKGLKEVTYEITRENGRQVAKNVVREVIVKEPHAQVILVGTKQVPGRGTGRFIWPVRGKITSRFGSRWGRMHEGIDVAARTGTSIYAADGGRVVFSGYRGSYGKLIIIDHGNGFTTYYAHNSVNLVSAGERVRKGEQIARVGNTGRSTGSHLHFEIRVNGSPKNPLKFL